MWLRTLAGNSCSSPRRCASFNARRRHDLAARRAGHTAGRPLNAPAMPHSRGPVSPTTGPRLPSCARLVRRGPFPTLGPHHRPSRHSSPCPCAASPAPVRSPRGPPHMPSLRSRDPGRPSPALAAVGDVCGCPYGGVRSGCSPRVDTAHGVVYWESARGVRTHAGNAPETVWWDAPVVRGRAPGPQAQPVPPDAPEAVRSRRPDQQGWVEDG